MTPRLVALSLVVLLAPLSASAAVPQLRLSLEPAQQRTVGARTWRIPVLRLAVAVRKPADVRSLFFALESRSRRGMDLTGESLASVVAAAELREAATGRTVDAVLVEEQLRGGSRFGILRVDDVLLSDNERWHLSVRLKGNKRIDWLRASVCGSMAEGRDPCMSADGGSQLQPWVQDMQTGNDIVVSPTLLEGSPVILRGVR